MLFRGELSPSAIKYSRNVKSLPVPCAHHLSSTVFCSRFPPLLFVELELQAHIQSGHFGLFSFLAPGSISSLFHHLWCCIALVIAVWRGVWRRSSKKRQDLVSLWMSLTYSTAEETTRRGLTYGTDMQSHMHRLLTRISQEAMSGQNPPRRL